MNIKPEIQTKLIKILEGIHIPEDCKKLNIPFRISDFPIKTSAISNISNQKKTILELGSGWGEFTIANAKLNPDSLIIAFEKKRSRVYKSIRDALKQNVSNIRWMIIDVDWVFSDVLEEESFDKIIINFPDPWPKKKHHKHRFFNNQLLETLTKIAKKNCDLEFATDYWPYMQEALSILESENEWINTNGKAIIVEEIEGRPISYFQQLKKKEGEHIYIAQFQKA